MGSLWEAERLLFMSLWFVGLRPFDLELIWDAATYSHTYPLNVSYVDTGTTLNPRGELNMTSKC